MDIAAIAAELKQLIPRYGEKVWSYYEILGTIDALVMKAESEKERAYWEGWKEGSRCLSSE